MLLPKSTEQPDNSHRDNKHVRLCNVRTLIPQSHFPQFKYSKNGIITSQESFCPFAYPAHKKDSKMTFVWPAAWNISWHTLFSIMGTWKRIKSAKSRKVITQTEVGTHSDFLEDRRDSPAVLEPSPSCDGGHSSCEFGFVGWHADWYCLNKFYFIFDWSGFDGLIDQSAEGIFRWILDATWYFREEIRNENVKECRWEIRNCSGKIVEWFKIDVMYLSEIVFQRLNS